MTSSERPSPEPILKKEASPAVLGGREFWKRSGSLKCLELEGLGHPSRTLQGNSRKRSESVSGVFPEFFRNFFRKVPAVLGVLSTDGHCIIPMLLLDVCSACHRVWDETMPWNFRSQRDVGVIKSWWMMMRRQRLDSSHLCQSILIYSKMRGSRFKQEGGLEGDRGYSQLAAFSLET